jgi:inner membrane protein
MDSVTQFVLGAGVAEATAGKRLGRAAPLWGGVIGTLPDLDVLIDFGSDVANFTYHRSFSHSVIVLTALAPALAWLVQRMHRRRGVSYRRCLATVWLVLVTHVLLDALTVYGTQLLWPLTEHPFGLGSVFIIDPAYTLPVALGVLAAVVLARRRPRLGRLANAVGLAAGGAYLAFGVAAQAHVNGIARASLERQGIAYRSMIALAAPFTALAWRVVVVADDHYYVAYHSLLAPAPELRLARFKRRRELLAPIAGQWAVARLRWFSKGFYTVDADAASDGVRITDLRMGVEPDRYAFSFVVGERRAERVRAVAVRRIPPRRSRDGDFGRLLAVVRGAPRL